MHSRKCLALIAVLPAMLIACNSRTAEPPSAPTLPAASIEASVVNQWLGQWTGPEGTLLWLARKGAGYQIKIQSLDGPNTYEGQAVGDHIEFQRNGVTESIHAGSGIDTGMKWLADKKDCLVIRQSEGFCRD